MEAMHSYYIVRAIGGLLFLLGALVGIYNVLMSVRRPLDVGADEEPPVPYGLQPAE
jgi:cytochrome c oxidase cbb3-type subunit 1